MNNLFDILFEKSDSAGSLDCFLCENMQIMNDFYNSTYGNTVNCKDSIERYILFKSSIIARLDFTKSYAKSFVVMLLDFCERFNLISSTPRICSVLSNNKIEINSRQQAALLFLYPRPERNSVFVERFDSICEKLQSAIDTEEDDENNAIATFLNYYAIVVNDTHIEFATQIRDKLTAAIETEAYPFLKSYPVSELSGIDLQDKTTAYTQIQCLIDQLLDKKKVAVDISRLEAVTGNDVLIETDTCYSGLLQDVPANFNSIRSISVGYATSSALTQRGVKILESESELFEYMKRFGNMHKAKLESAYDSLPEVFPSKVNLIDWGCGQGFASMLFIERFTEECINRVTLIEPSEIAIRRAALHIRKYAPDMRLQTICKKLDDLEKDDFINMSSETTVHLFSNILDIDDYSQTRLMQLIESTQQGMNYFVCVSPYIDEIKTERLDTFKRYFETRCKDFFTLLMDRTNSKNQDDIFWKCNNTYNDPSTSHGFHSNCSKWRTENGCNNKWTRVIKVFNINLPKFNE